MSRIAMLLAKNRVEMGIDFNGCWFDPYQKMAIFGRFVYNRLKVVSPSPYTKGAIGPIGTRLRRMLF